MTTSHKGPLVNENRLFGVVKRWFTGGPEEILGEMIQNSARAGSSRLDILIEEGRISFADDGNGFESGLEGFRKLLSIAESHYSTEVEIQQSPMGVGFYALLSHSEVREVGVQTGGKSIRIEVKRWFSDADYRNRWTDLVEQAPERQGTVVEATCETKLLDQFAGEFKADWWNTSYRSFIPPWVGYGKNLAINYNGKALPSELPEFLKLQPVIETEYLGNRLTIGFCRDRNHPFAGSYINWFGGLIPIDGLGCGLNLYLEVTGKNPVTPQSPTRKGIVRDEKWRAFEGFVRSVVLDFLEGQIAPPPVQVLEAGYWLFPELKKRLPWLIVKKLKPSGGDSFESRFFNFGAEILEKDADALILNESIQVLKDTGGSDTFEGLESFLPMIGKPAFILESGEALSRRLVWKPGALVQNKYGIEIRERGEWAIETENARSDWKPVTQDVYAFLQPVAWDICDADVIIGAKDVIQTVWAAGNAVFQYDGDIEDSWETTRQCFIDSVRAITRKLHGNVVPRNFSMDDLHEFIPKNQVLERIEFIREEGLPKQVRLVFSSGKTKILGFL